MRHKSAQSKYLVKLAEGLRKDGYPTYLGTSMWYPSFSITLNIRQFSPKRRMVPRGSFTCKKTLKKVLEKVVSKRGGLSSEIKLCCDHLKELAL